MNVNVLSDNVKRLRENQGMSVRKLARKSEISPAVISLIENKRRDGYDDETLQKLATAFNVTVSDLFTVQEGRYEVTEFMQAIELILSSDDLCIDGKLLNKEEKDKLLFCCEGAAAAIKSRRNKR